MFTFDPWKLLGVKTTSSIDEVRRAYYRLAMLVHPDKGGSAEDMRVLYEAYKWVYKQLEGASFPITVDDPSKTPIIDTVVGMDRKSLEECYEKLRANDDERTRTIALDWVKYLVERDLMTEADLKSTEDYVHEGINIVLQANIQDACYHASVQDGYGEYMDPSEDTYENYQDQDHDLVPSIVKIELDNEDKKESKHKFSKELTVYSEPICSSDLYDAKNPVDIPKKTDDYSAVSDGLFMTDYALAHSEHIISDTETYQKERKWIIENAGNIPPFHSYKYE